MTHNVTLIKGDGVGPEVMESACRVIQAAGVEIAWDVCDAGKKSFEAGISSGVPDETVESIIRNKVVLKGPLETPVGYGGKSANVTLRKLFETYGNIRPARTLPGVTTPFSDRDIDLVIIRENVEDLYTGIEHMQSPNVAQCLKVITRRGCEKIVRLAFEVARAEGRKTVHCATKANIMKLSEGMLKRVFEEIAPEYPDIEAHHIIIDNCAHQLVIHPEQFDVIVTTNLNGDIISDLCSGLVGGLGFAPSANLGSQAAIFEAVHGSAPTIAGQNIVNPTSVILSSVMMLRYLGEFDAADKIEQAVYQTLKQRIFTADVPGDHEKVTTTAFTDKVIENMGRPLADWTPRTYKAIDMDVPVECSRREPAYQEVGMDVMIRGSIDPLLLGQSLEAMTADLEVALHGISNRGMQVYPQPATLPDLVDSWQCRFKVRAGVRTLTSVQSLQLLARIQEQFEWSHVEKLLEVDGEVAYTKAQGE